MTSAADEGIQTLEEELGIGFVSPRPELPLAKTRLDKLLALRGGSNNPRRPRPLKSRVPADKKSCGVGSSLSSLQGHEAQPEPLTASGSNAADFSKDV